MVADTLILQVFVYGPGESRAEIAIRPKIPTDVQGDLQKLRVWSRDVVSIGRFDVKHSNRWNCSNCGKPARETVYYVASWIHLPEPRIVIYVHQACEAGTNPCGLALEDQHMQLALMSGTQFVPRDRLPKPAGVDYPLSSSCCGCQQDQTAKKGHPMNRCSGCKLIRYCSAECQKTDWPRHKKICKTIESVKWVNWEQS